ncbi:MAG: transcriptional regulator [Syntrophobacteraceae bacterium]
MGTVRQDMIDLLTSRELTARQISQELGIREREVYDHLPNIARSLTGQRRKLVALPFACMDCGHVFAERKRWTRPGRCPKCKNGHIQEPRFRVDRT